MPFMAKTPALFIPVLLKPSTVFCTDYATEWACPLEKRREAKKVDGNPLPRKLTHLGVLSLSPISPGPARKASLLFFPLLSLTPASYSSIVQINIEFLPFCGSLSFPSPVAAGEFCLIWCYKTQQPCVSARQWKGHLQMGTFPQSHTIGLIAWVCGVSGGRLITSCFVPWKCTLII